VAGGGATVGATAITCLSAAAPATAEGGATVRDAALVERPVEGCATARAAVLVERVDTNSEGGVFLAMMDVRQ